MHFFNSVTSKITSFTNSLSSSIQVIKIVNNLYHISYPNSTSELQEIISRLPNKNSKIQLWNLSQYIYPPELFEELGSANVDIVHLTFQYYSSIPLTVAVARIKVIQKFINSNSDNVVLVHCQSNKGRSSVFLAMYIYLTGIVADIASATVFVNQKLKIKSKQQTIYGSQHSLLKNIAIYKQDPNCIQKNHYKLVKVIINHAPKIPQIQDKSEGLRTYFQVKRNDSILTKMVTQQFGQGQALHFIMKQNNVILHDDCLISLKYIHNNKLYPVIRAQINSNFIFNNFIRLQMQEIDIVSNGYSKYVFVDIILQMIPDTQSDLWKVKNAKQQVNYNQMIKDTEQQTQQQKISKKQENCNLLEIAEKNIGEQKQKQEQKQKKENKSQGESEPQMDEFEFQIGGQSIDAGNEKETQQKINKRLQKMELKRQRLKETLDQIEAEQREQQEEDEGDQFQLQEEQTKEKDQLQENEEKQEKQVKEEVKEVKKKQEENERLKQDDEEEEDMDDYLSKLQKQA